MERCFLGFAEHIAAHAKHRRSLPAVVDAEGSSNWGEFHDLIVRYTGVLATVGVESGERVGLIIGATTNGLALAFAALSRGAVLVPFSGYLNIDALVSLARDAEISALLSDGLRPDLAGPLALELALPADRCWCVGTLDGFSDLRHVSDYYSAPNCAVSSMPDEPFNIIYSSGTTSMPKGIVITNRTRMALARTFGQCLSIGPDSTTLVSTPLSSNGAWVFVLPGLIVGGRTVLLQPFSVEGWLDAIEEHRVTHAFVVPTQLKAIFEELTQRPRDLSSIKALVSGGSRLDPALKQKLSQLLPNTFFELYGLTEGVGTLLYPPEINGKLGSVGRPLPGCEFVILDDNGSLLPSDAIGELVGRGPAMMAGYLNHPEADADISWRDADGRLFLRTGDIGRIDEDGFVHILDRRKDMIVSGGLNIFAADIETVLLQHPDVHDAAVVAIPDSKWGETPFAFVILKRSAVADTEEIRAWTNARVGKHQRLSGLTFREGDFPRNALGKPIKRQLRENYAAEMGTNV